MKVTKELKAYVGTHYNSSSNYCKTRFDSDCLTTAKIAMENYRYCYRNYAQFTYSSCLLIYEIAIIFISS